MDGDGNEAEEEGEEVELQGFQRHPRGCFGSEYSEGKKTDAKYSDKGGISLLGNWGGKIIMDQMEERKTQKQKQKTK